MIMQFSDTVMSGVYTNRPTDSDKIKISNAELMSVLHFNFHPMNNPRQNSFVAGMPSTLFLEQTINPRSYDCEAISSC
jgi:hypothetical protein